MPGQICAPAVPWGNILSWQSVLGCWLILWPLGPLHPSPSSWPPPLHSIWVIHTHGLSWPVASSVPLRAILYSKRSWPQIPSHNPKADRCMVAAWSPGPLPLSPSSFLFPPPTLPKHTQTHTHAKLFCLTNDCQMELYHTVLIGCN